MQHTPMAAAVGVELGTSTVTVSIRSGDKESEIRRFDGDITVETILDQVGAVREEVAGAPVPVAFAVPAAWGAERRRELADAAEQAGLGQVAVIPAPEAAAIYFTEVLGRELEPHAALVVCDLGATSFEVAVVSRSGDRYTCEHWANTSEVGGLEFDQLLLAYLSGRYRDTDPQFWNQVDAPGDAEEAMLRGTLLGEIRAARELLSKRRRTGIPLPIGDRDLLLTRAELASCIDELVAQSAGLVAATLDEAGVRATGLMLTGGASRTPLLAARLHDQTGLEPVLPHRPETALAEGARLAALASVSPPGPAPRGPAARRLGVLAAVLLPLVAAVAVLGSDIGTGKSPDPTAADPAGTVQNPASPDTATTPETEGSLGGADGQEPSGIPQPPTSDDDQAEAGSPPPPPAADDGQESDDDREESASTGTVPAVAGMPVQEAEKALNDAGYTDVELHGEQESLIGPWYDDCEVIEQDPAAGEQRPFSDQITITYSYDGADPSACEA